MKRSDSLRVLVVDDTVFYRKMVSDVLREFSDVEVVGTANNGKIAVSRIASLKPDLMTLDVEMPEMNGIEVLAYIREKSLDIETIMLSSMTRKGSELTIRALELGAFDFITKPQSGSMEENRHFVKHAVAPMLKAFARRMEIKRILSNTPALSEVRGLREGIPASKGEGEEPVNVIERMRAVTRRRSVKSEVIGIGISTGGPNALAHMLPRLPTDLGVPVLIVQHMPPVFTRSLADSLNAKCAMEVREAVDGQIILPDVVFIAPGGKQMKVASAADGNNKIIRITDDFPEKNCKPSVDYLFRSLAYHYGGKATGVIMTGMGSDGTLGLKLMKRYGATVIAQDEATCVVYGMPKEAVDAGVVDIIAPLDQLAAEICRTVKP